MRGELIVIENMTLKNFVTLSAFVGIAGMCNGQEFATRVLNQPHGMRGQTVAVQVELTKLGGGMIGNCPYNGLHRCSVFTPTIYQNGSGFFASNKAVFWISYRISENPLHDNINFGLDVPGHSTAISWKRIMIG